MSDECKINPIWSGRCDRGTAGCDIQHGSELAASDGSAALVREQDAANELYQAACTLMRYKEPQQWHNLENAAHRFNAARQGRINHDLTRQNNKGQP